MKRFPEILKNARNAQHITLRRLSAVLDIDTALISKIERGERVATREQVVAVIEYFKLDEKDTMAAWLADRVYQLLSEEEYGSEALMVAEAAIRYGKEEGSEKTVPDDIKHLLANCDELHTTWSSLKPLNGIQLQKMEEYFRLNYTYESNRIEGNTLTLQETHLVVHEGLTIGGKSMREHMEAVNHHEAIDFIADIARDKITITERLLKEIHYLILKGIDRENAGVYRKVPVAISGSAFLPPEPYLLDKLMEDVFLYYKREKNKLHPIILAAEMHERVVRVHPFIDGNGRTSRLLMNLILLQHGFPIANIKGDLDSRKNYYQALETAAGADKKAFHLVIIHAVEEALKEHIRLSR